MSPFIQVTSICPRYWPRLMQAPSASQHSLRSFKLTTAFEGKTDKKLSIANEGSGARLRKRKAFKADLRKPAAREKAEALPAGPTLGLTSLRVRCFAGTSSILHPSSVPIQVAYPQ